jgi:serine/threonine-protein kinase
LEGAAQSQLVSQGQLGKYRLIAELAQGGMGVVYLAVMQGLGGFYKTLVIKQLKPELAHDPSFLSMFMDEARVAARLQHPNIVQVYEVDSVGDRHFLSMEYLEGATLRRTLRVLKTEMTLGMHLAILSEILRGLHHAHELTDESGQFLGLVHRDMSPHNIFVTFDGQAKLVDFGIVKTRDSSNKTEVGVFKGKVTYMPPEQAMTEQPVDRRADIYSMGVMLWEAVSGRRLWKGMQDMQVLTKLVQKQIPTLEQVMPSAPAELKRICAKAMAWDRDDRYETAEAFREDLDAFIVAAKLQVNLRYVGTLLASALADERAKIRNLLDKKIAQLKAGGNMSKVVSIAPPPTLVREADDSQSIEAMLDERDFEPQEPEKKLQLVSELDGLEGESALVRLLRGGKWRLVRPQIFAASTVLVIVGIYFAFLAPPAPATTTTAEPLTLPSGAALSLPSTASTPSPIVLPPQQMIDVQIHVAPPNASVTVDDAPLKGPPFSVRLPKENATHTVRAFAPGFVTKSQDFGGDRDVLLDLSLAKNPPFTSVIPPSQPHVTPHVTPPQPPPPQTQTQTQVTPPPPEPPPTRTPPTPTSSVRPIDTSSPYSQ